MFYLFIFEFLGTNEVLVILVVALILLGPRKLPQMSRKIGKSLADFKRTSEEFKRTWEKEVDLESETRNEEKPRTLLPSQNSTLAPTVERGNETISLSNQSLPGDENEIDHEALPAPSVSPADPSIMGPNPAATSDEPALPVPTRKRDWL